VSIPYPDDAYISLVGRLAYAVTYLEGLVVNDLYRLRHHLPAELTLEKLAGEPTGVIGKLVTRHAQEASHPVVVAWLDAAGPILSKAAKIRNPVLHARPATTPDNKQQLFRWHPREQFPITAERLRQGIAEIERVIHELSDYRPPLRDFPPT
jgi:hypothetical protein